MRALSRSQKCLFLLLLPLVVLMGVRAAVAQPMVAEEVHDPIEGVNRKIFWFNDQFDTYLLKPVAQGYDDVVPNEGQRMVTNFFTNLRYPRYLVSDLVQGKVTQAGEHTARFILNSTLGVLGLFDVAARFGLEDNEEDFGLALAYHDVPAGPYLVLPFLGPSNLRDGFGTIVDTALDPFSILGFSDVRAGVADRISIPGQTVRTVQVRADLLDVLDSAREASVDYYLFVQGAYYQDRFGLLWDGAPPEEE